MVTGEISIIKQPGLHVTQSNTKIILISVSVKLFTVGAFDDVKCKVLLTHTVAMH